MTTFSPVTEQEMSDFLTRAMQTVREYTNLSTTLDQVRNELENLRTGLADTRAENDKLRGDINAASDLAQQAEKERDEARRKHEDEVARSRHLQDLITARDSRVTELQATLSNTQSENTSLNRECENLNNIVTAKEEDLKRIYGQRDDWKVRAEKAEHELKEAKDDLSKVEGMVKQLAIFNRPKEEPKVEAHPSQGSGAAQQSSEPTVTSQYVENVPEMKPVIHDDDKHDSIF